MQVKRFVAPTITEAIAEVRAAFGPDAVILQTGKARQPGFWGFFRPAWVAVTAGLEEVHERGLATVEPVVPASTVPMSTAADTPASAEPQVPEPPAQQLQAPIAPPAAAPNTAPVKLTELAVLHLLERLREQEVVDDYLNDLGTELRQRVRLGGEAPQQQLFKLLIEHFPPAQPWQFSDTPLVVPLVGPTGVGKTTTVAKLAATYALVMGYRVGMVTADTYRVAAVEQLRTYADILNVPLEVLYSPQEAPAAIERLSDRQLILVDTAGRSPHNTDHMGELSAFLAEMGAYQAQLVLSATTRFVDQAKIIDTFVAHAQIDSLIITKLDETRCYGCLYNAVKRLGKPISFVTSGQGVPEDIRAAEPGYLAGLLAGVEA